MKTIAVIGDARVLQDDPRWRLAYDLGQALVGAGYRIQTGGRGGIMEAVSAGGHQHPAHQPGQILGILPGDDASDANAYLDVAIPTGLGHLRNALVVRADAVVAIGGSAGTLSEIALAWVHHRPLAAYRVEGWSGRLADTRLDDRVRFPGREDDRIVGVDRAAEVLAFLDDWLA